MTATIEGQTVPFFAAYFEEGATTGYLLYPLGVLTLSTNSSSEDTRNFEFNFRDGDQIIEETKMEDLGIGRVLWTLTLKYATLS